MGTRNFPLPTLLALAIAAPLLMAQPVASAAPAGKAKPQTNAKARSTAQRLDALYANYWQANLKLNPVSATYYGDARYNDQLPDTYSTAFRNEEHAFNLRWLNQARAIGNTGLNDEQATSYAMFVSMLEDQLEGDKYNDWMLPVNQMGSLPTTLAQLGSGSGAQPFATVKDYDNWLKRVARVPVLVDSVIGNMQAGVKAGVVQPRILMEKVVPQYDALLNAPKIEDSVFWGPVAAMPANFSAADKQRLTQAYRKAIEGTLQPSIRKLRDYVANDYMKHTRSTVGLSELPNGKAWYAYRIRHTTTLDQTPEEIHAIGLSEVARIHGEIENVMKAVGFKGDMQAFFKFMREDKQFEHASRDALLAHYRAVEGRVMKGIPSQFSVVPKAGFEIRTTEPFREQSAAGGEYQSPSEDGKRPGIFYVNAYDLPSRRKWEAEDLFLHEAIPGHHFQIALSQELKGVPAFRRMDGNTAYVEGWALYAESLGKDLGVYTDPYMYFGRLQDELWRAIRLVTDTGLHSKGWTREQTIQYMQANSASSLTDSTIEAERYIAWPSQALAYKTGELTIQRLKQKAKTALGDRFDPREFHAQVLGGGALPLKLLEAKIDRWIASKKG